MSEEKTDDFVKRLERAADDGNARPVDAALFADAARELRALSKTVDDAKHAMQPFVPCAPDLHKRGREAAQALWFKALASLPDERVLVMEEGSLFEWRLTMGDLRRARNRPE